MANTSKYETGTEPDQFTEGHHRATILCGGGIIYLSQKSWPTVEQALAYAEGRIDSMERV